MVGLQELRYSCGGQSLLGPRRRWVYQNKMLFASLGEDCVRRLRGRRDKIDRLRNTPSRRRQRTAWSAPSAVFGPSCRTHRITHLFEARRAELPVVDTASVHHASFRCGVAGCQSYFSQRHCGTESSLASGERPLRASVRVICRTERSGEMNTSETSV